MTRSVPPVQRLPWASLPPELQEKVLQAGTHKTQLDFGRVSKDARALTQELLGRHANALPGPLAAAPAPRSLHAWVRAQNTSEASQPAWSAALEAQASTPLLEVQGQAQALAGLLEEFARYPATALRGESLPELVAQAHAAAPEQRATIVSLAHRVIETAAEAAVPAGEFVGPQAHAALRALHQPEAVDAGTRRNLLGLSLAALRNHPAPPLELAVTQAARERRATLLDSIHLAESLGLPESEHGPHGEHAILLHECLNAMFTRSALRTESGIGLFVRRLCQQAAQGPEETRSALRSQFDTRLAGIAPDSQKAQMLTLSNMLGPR